MRYVRSDYPGNLSDSEIKWLLEKNITTIVDLREEKEYVALPCRLENEEGFIYYHLPVTGGGDTPEAVHTALEVGLTQLQWHNSAYSKLAFIILDAPAHKDHQGVIESLQNSVRQYAAKGIKIIPVFCSSHEKDCEFMCRQFAILTNGTYVFLTNDSGVGGEHIEASVGEYQVESLQGLIVRLITKYIQ